MNLPKSINFGGMGTGHIQGIATDTKREYMYYSFTTSLVKTDMKGNVIGSVNGLAGHLGCIAYNYENGKLYGSLEYKHDAIGSSILSRINNGSECEIDVEDGFYIAIFDVEKIDRIDMDAERDSVMSAVYLDKVTEDYKFEGHRYGCSGIDGMTFAPVPASADKKKYVYVAYGIYSDTEREDNDRQVLLRYDWREFDKYAAPLNQKAMHRCGPKSPEDVYFVYTGNTEWGVQNLEYDDDTGYMFLAVYNGHKPSFPNYPMFVANMNEPAKEMSDGKYISLKATPLTDEKTGISGIDFPYGSTGTLSLGGGYFYFSRPYKNNDGWGTDIGLYRFDGEGSFTET